jgi:hypothetical protein
MRRIKHYRPSPATVLASIALFVSLGGVSYGVATGSIDSREIRNNTVRSKDIRNNQVSSRDIRNNSVRGRDVRNSTLTGADVKNDKLTGADVLESSLGLVPAANASNFANRANSAGAVDSVLTFPLKRAAAAADLASAPQVALGTKGAFSFYGKCYKASGRVQADIYVALTSGVATFSTEDQDDSTPATGYLKPSTPETDRLVEETNTGAAANSFDADNEDADFRATDGTTAITGVVGLAEAKQGSPAAGDGPFGSGDACLFGGSVFG